MSAEYSEDRLVQQTTANFFEQSLKWHSVYAYKKETFGTNGTLGRKDKREVVLTRYLRQALEKFNPGHPQQVYDDAIAQFTSYNISDQLITINQKKYQLIREGILEKPYKNPKGETINPRLKVIDFEHPENNHFLVVREMSIQGSLYSRRPDIIGFVNGIPLLFIELKAIHRNVRVAYEDNYTDYKDTIPELFHYNAIVMLSNGIVGKVGSITSPYSYFQEWKRLEEEEKGKVDFQTMLMGMCPQDNFLDILENFIVFDDSSGKTIKILARNHQFLGVNRAFIAIQEREVRKGKLGVFWHTQGSGKSYSIAFLTRKVHRQLIGNFTFVINAVCTNDESRARFDVLAREVFKKKQALITEPKLTAPYQDKYNAIEAIQKHLQEQHKKSVDINAVLYSLQNVVSDLINVDTSRLPGADSGKIYNISKIDFDVLKAEFANSPAKNISVQSLKEAVERQLQRMLKQNPSRIDYYVCYQQIIQDYNRETDRVTIEQTFEELLKLVQDLSEEDTRAVREGLSEEHLAVFDLLCASKDNLDARTRNRVKQVAQLLIQAVKVQLKQLENWRDKESTKATIKSFIYDYLYSEDSGLPIDAYDDSDVDNLSNVVFLHVYQQYESADNHPYAA
ncbi:type I restriction endonuclease [Nostoc sp.]|uniref:type I restriction endonuclease n=1 Tax=Nostoc sp. TaxID=1180 RepID=UPI002FF61A5C